jgi:hypothetical protein
VYIGLGDSTISAKVLGIFLDVEGWDSAHLLQRWSSRRKKKIRTVSGLDFSILVFLFLRVASKAPWRTAHPRLRNWLGGSWVKTLSNGSPNFSVSHQDADMLGDIGQHPRVFLSPVDGVVAGASGHQVNVDALALHPQRDVLHLRTLEGLFAVVEQAPVKVFYRLIAVERKEQVDVGAEGDGGAFGVRPGELDVEQRASGPLAEERSERVGGGYGWGWVYGVLAKNGL